MELTAKNVFDLCRELTFEPEEIPSDMSEDAKMQWAEKNAKVCKGIMSTICFNPAKIPSHREEIISMVQQLPTDFFVKGGGGTSFLNLCMRRDGVHWGEHRDCEMLVMLAMAIDVGKYLMPREMWSAFPGGMPYVQFSCAIDPIQQEVAQ